MRINEKMGLVYTALFLTVSIAVITQNSDELMAKFRGENGAMAVDDIYTVVAGREHDLTILRNDLRVDNIKLEDIRLLGQPLCGEVAHTGATFKYTSTKECEGHQAFSYCLNTGRSCQAASVALRIVEARDPINSIVEGPILDVAGFDAQLDINSNDLEISNIRLGKIAGDESTSLPVTAKHLPEVEMTPADLAKPPSEIAEQSKKTADDTQKEVRVAQLGTTAKDTTTPKITADVRLPSGPDLGALHLATFDKSAKSLARAARREAKVAAPSLIADQDLGPFGTGCTTRFDLMPEAEAQVGLTLVATCYPNSRVEIHHGALTFAVMTDATGHAAMVIPALEANARFALILPGGKTLVKTVPVMGMERIRRVAIHWTGDAEIDLHAFEFGASEGDRGHIWEGQQGQVTTGSLVTLGDRDAGQAHRAEIYTLPAETDQTGVIDFMLAAYPAKTNCGQSQVVRTVQSQNGRIVGASGIQLKLPACGAAPASIVLKNAIRDMIIARN